MKNFFFFKLRKPETQNTSLDSLKTIEFEVPDVLVSIFKNIFRLQKNEI